MTPERAALLRRFDLTESEIHGLRNDPGFVADLEGLIGRTLVRFDPQIRKSMIGLNAALGQAGAPGAILSLILSLVEPPALDYLERNWGTILESAPAEDKS